MPTDYPGASEVHVDALLSNISIGYKNPSYIADQIFPTVLVNKRSDIVPKYYQSDWYRRRAKRLGEREAPPVSGYNVDTSDTYYCHNVGDAHFISDDRRANQDAPFNADRDGVSWVTDGILLEQEYQFVTDFWKTAVWDTDKVGTTDFTKWSVYGTSLPIQDLRAWKRIARRLTGRNPNKLILGDLTYDVLCDHPNVLDRIKYSAGAASPAMVTPQLIAQLLGFDEVLVGLSQYTASPEGTAEGSVTYTPLWDDDALLVYVPNSPSLFTPAAGYTFTWRTAFGGPRYIKRRRDPQSDRGDLIEAFQYSDMKQTASAAGVFVSDAVD